MTERDITPRLLSALPHQDLGSSLRRAAHLFCRIGAAIGQRHLAQSVGGDGPLKLRSLLLPSTPKLRAQQHSTDRDGAWHPGSEQRCRCWVNASPSASSSNTADDGQTKFERKG